MTLTIEKPISSVLFLFNVPQVYYFTFKIASSLCPWYHSILIMGTHKQMLPFLFVCLFHKPLLLYLVSQKSDTLYFPAGNKRERFKNTLEDILKFFRCVVRFFVFSVCWLFFGQHLGHLWCSPAFQSWARSRWVKFSFNHTLLSPR